MITAPLIIFSALFGCIVGYYINKVQMKILSTKALKRMKKSSHIQEEFRNDINKLNTHLSEGNDHPKRDEELLKGKDDQISIDHASSQYLNVKETAGEVMKNLKDTIKEEKEVKQDDGTV